MFCVGLTLVQIRVYHQQPTAVIFVLISAVSCTFHLFNTKEGDFSGGVLIETQLNIQTLNMTCECELELKRVSDGLTKV